MGSLPWSFKQAILILQISSAMASSGSPLLRHLFNSLVKAVTEVKELKEEKEYVNREECSRDRSYSVTSIDSGYFEGSSQGCPLRLDLNEKRQKRDPGINLPIISLDEVSEHSSRNDGWMVIYDRVYDVTNFLREHPGGEEVIERDLFQVMT